jgi:carbamoyl-phosphate synthase large subunit
VKLPKWPFDKFVYAKRVLGTQMKATGEVMAIAPNFEMAIMKAVRGAEISLDSLNLPKLETLSKEQILQKVHICDDERLFVVFEALKRGITPQEINDITKIDKWFLYKLLNLINYEKELSEETGYVSFAGIGYDALRYAFCWCNGSPLFHAGGGNRTR